MILLVIWLFVETQRAINRERRMRLDGKVAHSLTRERCTYAIVSTLFGLSYVGRFIDNDFMQCGTWLGSFYTYEIVNDLVYLFEGLSMGVMMLFHWKNF